ncbi:DEAD/DEAH box helicase [Enterobacter ludwigii]|uniref:DEAD/DEAH box helicase n=1 Tax=Enterobacter ludwigii TaxID=299767 RepID=UPI002FD2D57A
MKSSLPVNHNLSDKILECLLYKEHDAFSLTDIQHESLEKGIGSGEDLMVVSPTSTGKTLIGSIAIAKGLQNGFNTVFLVTHRALAKQKFEDFKVEFVEDFLDGDKSSLILASGDLVEDAAGNTVSYPLSSRIIVATYEKYLGLLSASGVPKDMTSTVFVCDEIQLIGDEFRGQQVEILLTLIKRAGWAQLIALSAVLDKNDAQKLADWLDVKFVYTTSREKHLIYECRSLTGDTYECHTADEENIKQGRIKAPKNSIVENIKDYLENNKNQTPIVVFCMTKKQTFDLADSFSKLYQQPLETQIPIEFIDLPDTSSNSRLKDYMQFRVACHSTDLIEEEREIVENKIKNRKIDIVFATSTLSAGVNYPFGTAFFASWKRRDYDKKIDIPIPSSEFHNMSGRVGRMGTEHVGRIIFFANNASDLGHAKNYLNFSAMPRIKGRVEPKKFEHLCLQLTSAGLCSNLTDLKEIIFTTFSGISEQDNNLKAFLRWDGYFDEAIKSLTRSGLLLISQGGNLIVTPFGKAVSLSGFKVESGVNILEFFSKNSKWFFDITTESLKDDNKERLILSIFYACFCSPEFTDYNGNKASRSLPWMLRDGYLMDPDRLNIPLYESIWHTNLKAVNASKLAYSWIEGEQFSSLEGNFNSLTAGALNEVFRNLAWMLKGISKIIVACSDPRIPQEMRPLGLDNNTINELRILPRLIGTLSKRVNLGLPDKALWLASLDKIFPDAGFKLTRNEMIKIANSLYSTPEFLGQSDKDASNFRVDLFKNARPSPNPKANWLREAARAWKKNQRLLAAERHIHKAKAISLESLFKRFYNSRGSEYENVFEEMLIKANIEFDKLDDGIKRGAPDYLIKLANSPELVFELKTKQGEGLVDLNSAADVLQASELHKLKDKFCVTLCHPGVDPSVLSVIESCGRLAVVEGHDLGEAMLRLFTGTLTQQQLWQWLNVPGLALAEDLP